MRLSTGTYYFDQFDVKLNLPTYTDEEYDQWLQGDDCSKSLAN